MELFQLEPTTRLMSYKTKKWTNFHFNSFKSIKC